MNETKVTQHTPGPWIVQTRTVKAENGPDYTMSDVLAPNPDAGKAGVCYSGEHFSIVADMDCEADACLIAAAPELLEALEKIAEWHERPIPAGYSFDAWMYETASLARAAIAKARGG